MALSISGIPAGATLTDGVHNFTATAGATSVNITSWTLANLKVTPPLHFTGDLQLTFNATSTDTATLSTGVATDTKTVSQTININVISVNDAPVALADHLTTNEDTLLTVSAASLLANDTDANGDVLSVTSVGNVSHGTVKLVNGNVVFTADANFSGIAKFDYTVSDGRGGTSTATATVDVKPVADAAGLTAQNATGIENTSFALNVNAAPSGDSDGSGFWL